jgi:hypothetical protein
MSLARVRLGIGKTNPGIRHPFTRVPLGIIKANEIDVVPAQEASFSDVLIYFLPKLRFSARDEIDCMGCLRRKPCSLVSPSSPAIVQLNRSGMWTFADAGRGLPTKIVRKHHNLT